MVDASAGLQLLAFVLALLGFGWIALSMDSHWRQVFTSPRPGIATARWLRALGFSTVTLACLLSFIANRPSIAVLVSIMLLAVAAPAIGMTLTWRPALLRMIWRAPAETLDLP
ncbi:MAG: DUF3325 domain-containing protein [Pseudomonadota bacterium]